MGLFSKWVESLDYEFEVLKSCTRHRSPWSTCEKCLEACGEKAISLQKGKPVIDTGNCVECGDCLSACPEQAIAGIFPKRTIFQNQLVITKWIPTVKELLLFYKKGIRALVYEDSSLCEKIEPVIVEANSILEELGEEPFTISLKTLDKSEETYSRRELFSFWKTESQSLMKQVAPAKWRFNQDDLDQAKYYPDFQFRTITVDIEKCNLCLVCQKLCRKNCFTLTEDEFILSPQSCSSCQLCIDVCQENAITIEEKITPSQKTHYPVYNKTCTDCQKTFKTLSETEGKCMACTKRKGFLKSF